jgi:hypothetical protein
LLHPGDLLVTHAHLPPARVAFSYDVTAVAAVLDANGQPRELRQI